MRIIAITSLALAAILAGTGPGAAAPLSVRDSFRIGSSGTIFCSAQVDSTDKLLTSMFDNGYSITCRDAALPVGKMYKLRDLAGAPARLAAARAAEAVCDAAGSEQVAGLGTVETISCKLKDADVGYKVYQLRKGRLFYAVEGLAGYDSALVLGLRSLVADQPVKG